MNPHFKMLPADRDELIRVYIEHGMEAVLPLCAKHGVSGTYARNAANAAGLHRARGKYKKGWRTATDHRWAWAKARGEIVA